MLAPVIEEAAEDMPEIQFYKVDVDEAPELARSFKVMSVPTLAFFKNGELVYKLPSLPEIKEYCAKQTATLWPEVQRFDNPHNYYVDLSEKLMALKDEMLRAAAGNGSV